MTSEYRAETAGTLGTTEPAARVTPEQAAMATPGHADRATSGGLGWPPPAVPKTGGAADVALAASGLGWPAAAQIPRMPDTPPAMESRTPA